MGEKSVGGLCKLLVGPVLTTRMTTTVLHTMPRNCLLSGRKNVESRRTPQQQQKKNAARGVRDKELAKQCRVYAKPHLHLGRRLDKCLVSHGLGAVPAVFRATARLNGQEGTLLDLGGVEEHAVN